MITIFIIWICFWSVASIIYHSRKYKRMTQDERDEQRMKTKEAAKGIASGAVIGTAVVITNLVKNSDKPPK